MATKLNKQTLTKLSAGVSVPSYEPGAISAGIVHIGVGNFHRAHQAVYLDKLFNLGLDHDWGIIGAGLRPSDKNMRNVLREQDWLSTVVELDPAQDTARVCAAMIDFVEIDPQKLIEQLCKKEIRIVSLTITEGGYYRDEKSGGFNASHPEIVYDSQHPDTPKTVFGVLLAALDKRRQSAVAPFTIMSCDNLPGNGHVTQQAMVGLAQLHSTELADWVSAEVSFPNAMVDCITPATGDRERNLVREKFAIDDAMPVVCEPFRQWVLEDKFPQGRPALEKVGVEFVADVAPHELMKLRLLNGGHASLSYPAALLGVQYVHEAMQNELVSGFMSKLIQQEVIPIVPEVVGFDFHLYFTQVRERFSNPKIADTIPRLCLDGSNRQPKFILPSIVDRLEQGLAVDGLALEVALWCRYCAGYDEAGNAIDVVDENAQRLQEKALLSREHPAAFLELSDIIGPIADDSVFTASFISAIKSLWDRGVAATLQDYIAV